MFKKTMPCYKPLQGWRLKIPNESGKHSISFKSPSVNTPPDVEVPCGRCIGCRLEYSRQWALRCMHESQLHDENCFLTLTYSPDNIPECDDNGVYAPGTVVKRDWQLFLKRLRKKLEPKKIRFYMAGEYGEKPSSEYKKFGHPHYHSIVFGWYPPERGKNNKLDLEPVSTSASGDTVYRSEMLEKIWGKGHVYVGSVSFESAAYVARYVTKKINGELSEEHYQDWNPDGTKLVSLSPEFSLCSRRPGIAKKWFQKYQKDLHKGFITVRGIKMQAAKYYDGLLEEANPTVYAELKEQRKKMALENKEPDSRLKVREKLKRKKLKLLPRTLENET
ncbi:replication initiator protein [Microviridae sp.]|nr:replication initiator protein [Microviridae sp.]